MNRHDALATVAAKTRNGYELLSPFNHKGVKSEAQGYLQAMLYMAPHTLGGGKTLCPHSTPSCRQGCLYSAGRGAFAKVERARQGRTYLFLRDREEFMWTLVEELTRLQKLADREGLKLAIRLNGTTDIRWELETIEGRSLFDLFGRATFFDYTRIPDEHRHCPPNWHLTFSLADHDPAWAARQLRLGRSVAAIVPDAARDKAPGWFTMGTTHVDVVDGEIHDLRFLDPPGALVLLKPKGRLLRGNSPMVHSRLIEALIEIGRDSLAF